jgi:hypothetical protein
VRLGETGIGERGDIVLGWLVRLCVVILVAGLVLFDAISVGLAHMSVGDDAQAAADSWQRVHRLAHYAVADATGMARFAG